MKQAVLAFVLLALVAGGVWLARLSRGGRERAAAVEAAPAKPEDALAAKAELVLASTPEPVVREEVPAAAVETREVPELAQEPASAEKPGLPLSGTIVVVDENGSKHPAEDGSFSFVLWSGNSGAWHEVEVQGGRWSTELPAEPAIDALGVEAVQLGGRATLYVAEAGERFPVPADGWLVLHVRWPPASLLHVRDRQTGRELDPVFLTEVNDDWPKDFGHPGAAAQDARDLGPSPVRIPPAYFGFMDMRKIGRASCRERV